MKFLHGTLYTAELDSPLESSIFQCFVMLFIIIPPSSMALGSSTLIVNFVAL
ncbi:BnaC08g15500D [Brassica napus]|uniref:BnaC08g15500D protein n=1 Tax=Brassica napus TaxID=3708 RepID=A0A078GXR1_BRANA|nr:BnaC08g15500D [Brassica napus]